MDTLVSTLQREIDFLKDSDAQTSEDLTKQLNTYKRDFERIIESQTKGAILRAKVRWYNKGEKILNTF